MTFKDLQRVIESQPSSQSQLQKLKGKIFWNWGSYEHRRKHATYRGNCCFNHIIGPPKKDGVEKPFYDYEKLLYNALLGSHGIGSYNVDGDACYNSDSICPNRIKQ